TTATTESYTLSLHDALPISLNEFKRASNEFKAQVESEIANLERDTTPQILPPAHPPQGAVAGGSLTEISPAEREDNHIVKAPDRSEEHTSELQSRSDLVCRL